MTVFRLPIGELSDFAYPPTPLGGRQKVRRLQPEEKYPLDGPTEKIRQVVIRLLISNLDIMHKGCPAIGIK